MHPYISIGGHIQLDSWQIMTTLAMLCGSSIPLASLNKEMGLRKALLLVLVLGWGAQFGAHLGHRLLFWEFYLDKNIPLRAWCNQGHTLLGAAFFDATLLFTLSRMIPTVRFWSTADTFSRGMFSSSR